MNVPPQRTQPDFRELPNLTIRQLEVFYVVCRELSYANAALELRTTRANIKRVCEDFEKTVGRPLFEELDRELRPTPFAQGLLDQVHPLSRALRRLGECVKSQHEKGRIVRFAAADTFFKGGLFTDFLGRLRISDAFRPCFLRIETKRFRTALLNAECDVYFGVGITVSDRLEMVNLGQVPWRVEANGNACPGESPKPTDLPKGKWWIADAGDPEESAVLLEKFHQLGARDGRILTEEAGEPPAHDHFVFRHDTTALHPGVTASNWPCYQFSAVLRKHHPYSELLPRLSGACP